MSTAATAEKPDLKAAPEPEEMPEQAPDALGQSELFLSDDYAVTSLEATLGGITEAIDTDHPLYGMKVGDNGIDLVIRNVRVTSSKNTDKGKVSLILFGETLDVLAPKGLPE